MTVGGDRMAYIGDYVEDLISGEEEIAINVLGMPVFQWKQDLGQEETYIHADHLGSVAATTDDLGYWASSRDYYPYGEQRVDENRFTPAQFESRMSYSNKEVDDETTLSYFEARYLNREAGRFISQDPWAGDLTDPQSLNKYAYARNNPISYVDTNGEFAVLAFAWALAEVAFTAWDVVDTYHAWTNPVATPEERTLATGFLVLGIAGPGGGYGHIDDAAKIGKKIATDPVGVVKGVGEVVDGAADNIVTGLSKFSVPKPQDVGESLKKIVDELYRPGASIGNGSTADAIRHELQTGELVGGKSHVQKGTERFYQLQKWIENNADSADLDTAKDIANDLKKALNGE